MLATELRRLRSLVEADIETADRLHADDYQLVTPSGRTLDKHEYLTAVADGTLRYRIFEPSSSPRTVVGADVAVVRYRARIAFGDGDAVPAMECWHTDVYRRAGVEWRVVWSQATEITNPSR